MSVRGRDRRARPRPAAAAIRSSASCAGHPSSPRRARPWPPSRRSASGWRSGSGRRGRRPRRARREPVALGADQQRDARRSQPEARARARQRPPAPAHERDRRPRQPAIGPLDARRAARVNTAPMLARTALGPNGSALPGPSATLAGAERLARERSTVPTLPGSRTPCRYDAQRPGRRRRPALLVDRQRRACPSPARRRRPAARARPRSPGSAAAGRRSSARPAAQPAASAAASRSSPSATNRPARSRSRRRCVSLRISLSFWLWGLVMVMGSMTTKRAPSCEERRPGGGAGVSAASLSRPPAPRGRGRQNVGRCRRRGRRCRPGSCGRARRRRAAGRA